MCLAIFTQLEMKHFYNFFSVCLLHRLTNGFTACGFSSLLSLFFVVVVVVDVWFVGYWQHCYFLLFGH